MDQHWRKVWWLVVGLLAPEIVAYTAWYQRRAAVNLTTRMRQILNPSPAPSYESLLGLFVTHLGFDVKSEKMHDVEVDVKQASERQHAWTMAHSFYAVMGGFAFDTREAKPAFLPNNRVRLSINPRGVAYIAEKAPDLIPDLSKEFIRDKSKASGLVKLLVCLQALWFCIQCVLRLAQGYAIALLELNTFGHALCALLIYALWWDKPLDIEDPTFLSGEKAWEFCALMSMSSYEGESFLISMWTTSGHWGGEIVNGERFGDQTCTSWLDLFRLDPRRSARQMLVPRMVFAWSPSSTQLTENHESPEASANEGSPIDIIHSTLPGVFRKGQSAFGFRCVGPWVPLELAVEISQSSLPERVEAPSWYQPSDPSIWVDESHMRRLDLCSRALQQYNPVIDRRDMYKRRYQFQNTVSDRMRNWPSAESLNLTTGDKHNIYFSSGIAVAVAVFFYGGLHLLAWNAPFASTAESVLWKSSGTVVASSGILYLSISILFKTSQHIRDGPKPGSGWLWRLGEVFSFVAVFTGALVYIFARAYLTIECFLQLVRLPDSAYQLPSWSQYYPHIS